MQIVKGNYFGGAMVIAMLLFLLLLIYFGGNYYTSPVEQRFFHAKHETLKPSGSIGHGYGIIGSLCMIIGVSSYMIRKRNKNLSRVGTLKKWLEFHIFLCSVGPLLVLFHTAFKFGGIVAISFWSMVAVVLSGVIGRFIYNQIPRSIQGQELTLHEITAIRQQLHQNINELTAESGIALDEAFFNVERKSIERPARSLLSTLVQDYKDYNSTFQTIKENLSTTKVDIRVQKRLLALIKSEMQFRRKITRLQRMQKLFRSWHVVHLPFALIMLIIMMIHVIVTLTFGYRWIF